MAKQAQITKESVTRLASKIALEESHTGTGVEHLTCLAIISQALDADTLKRKLEVIAHFSKNASAYKQDIERWKNPSKAKQAIVDDSSYQKYLS